MNGWYVIRNDLTALEYLVSGIDVFVSWHSRSYKQATSFSSRKKAKAALEEVSVQWPGTVMSVVYFKGETVE